MNEYEKFADEMNKASSEIRNVTEANAELLSLISSKFNAYAESGCFIDPSAFEEIFSELMANQQKILEGQEKLEESQKKIKEKLEESQEEIKEKLEESQEKIEKMLEDNKA